MPKLIEPKFKKTPKNRKKDKAGVGEVAKEFGKMIAPFGIGGPLTAGSIAYMGKISQERDESKSKKPKKASPEIKADAAKKGKMIKLKGGGAAIRGTNFKGVF